MGGSMTRPYKYALQKNVCDYPEMGRPGVPELPIDSGDSYTSVSTGLE